MTSANQVLRNLLVSVFLLGGASALVQAGDLRPLAAELGITAESLIVADVHDQAATLLNRMDAASEARQMLAAQRAAIAQQADQVELLQAQAGADPQNVAVATELAAAQTQLSSLEQQARTTLIELREFVLADLHQDGKELLEQWMDAVRHQAPDEFGVLALSDTQWRSVQRALRAENRAQRRGGTLDQLHADHLATLRADFEVVAAKQRLSAHLEAIRLVFDQYSE